MPTPVTPRTRPAAPRCRSCRSRGNPSDIAIDAATGTIYVAAITDSGPELAVFNGATCNATITAGCNQSPATLHVDTVGSQLNIAVDQTTNTIYATNVDTLLSPWTSPGVYMVDGATCDATNTMGCGQAPALMGLGLSSTSATGPGTIPWGIAVDEATDTLYVTLMSAGDYAATVAVINGATCNGSVATGCNQIAPQVAVGWNALGVAVDAFTHNVYTTNFYDSSVSVVDGATCNGLITFGCGQTPPKLPAAHNPASIVLDPAVATAYVAGESGISVLPLAP